MKRPKPAPSEAPLTAASPNPSRVSLRSIYADAMREVLADPRKAIAEHDPWLLTLEKPAAGQAEVPSR